jgi:3-hydroxyisobutyrate dehydrogenase/2-hydroxy-3-oxopropionate reductase
MGYPMARNLLQSGHEVYLWSHTTAKAQELAKSGKGRACSTPAEVGAASECVFLCVGDSSMSEQVVVGENGIVHGAKPGTVVVDASTISPAISKRMHEELSKKGFHFLDAPCTGSRPGAEGGTLTFMIGGDPKVFERVKPWLEPMGKQLYYCGGPGMGLHAKLTQNLILSNILQAFNEGMVLATKAGVNPNLMLEILNNSAAKSGLISYKAPFVFKRDFSTNFSVKWMHKDIGLVLDSADDLAVPLPLTAVTQQMFRAAIAQGLAEEDFCATIKVLEGLTGTEVRGQDSEPNNKP